MKMTVEKYGHLVNTIENFAQEKAKLRLEDYKNNKGGTTLPKSTQDNRNGAWGEVFFRDYLSEKYKVKMSEVDFTINKGNYDVDLTCNNTGFRFHIKTQDEVSEKRFGKSWMINKHNKKCKGNFDEKDYMVLCNIYKSSEEDVIYRIELSAILQFKDIYENDLLDCPHAPSQARIKYALYLNPGTQQVKEKCLLDLPTEALNRFETEYTKELKECYDFV
tara:strand:+ start:274 stop:930 length:657 start_codon:yes stop_codon:yes gene_type:complete